MIPETYEIAGGFFVVVWISLMIAAAVIALLSALERRAHIRGILMSTQDKDAGDHPYHDEIRPTQEARYADWLAKAQDAITKLSKERADGIVSTDDIWEICPPPPGVEPRALGALWQPRSRWQKIDYVPSTRVECHKRPIARWRYIRSEDLREAAE